MKADRGGGGESGVKEERRKERRNKRKGEEADSLHNCPLRKKIKVIMRRAAPGKGISKT